jgi:hypothetical protein
MKKIYSIAVCLLFMLPDAFSQPKSTLELYLPGTTQKLQNGQELAVNVTSPVIPASFKLDIKNSSATNLNAWLHKVYRNVVPGSLNEFCWGETCYLPKDTVSLDPISFGANETKLLAFEARYYAKSISGESRITYMMCVGQNFQDYSFINVTFKYSPAGVEKQPTSGKMVSVISDPSGSRVIFKLVNPPLSGSKIILRNVLGVKLNEIATESAVLEYPMDITTLENGIYIFSIESEGQARYAGKMMVKH